MNTLVMLCGLMAVAYSTASPTISARSAALRAMPALQHEEIHDEWGQYALRFVTAEGTIVSERGHLVPTPDGKGYVLVVEGETTYIGDDGKPYVTKYSAGLDGAHAEGAHLPTPPPAPVQ